MRSITIAPAILAALCSAVSSADAPAKPSAEVQVLERFVGTWDIKMTIRVPGQEPVHCDTAETRKMSRGGTVLLFDNPEPPEFHMMWSYDPKAKKYTGIWMFGGGASLLGVTRM